MVFCRIDSYCKWRPLLATTWMNTGTNAEITQVSYKSMEASGKACEDCRIDTCVRLEVWQGRIMWLTWRQRADNQREGGRETDKFIQGPSAGNTNWYLGRFIWLDYCWGRRGCVPQGGCSHGVLKDLAKDVSLGENEQGLENNCDEVGQKLVWPEIKVCFSLGPPPAQRAVCYYRLGWTNNQGSPGKGEDWPAKSVSISGYKSH